MRRFRFFLPIILFLLTFSLFAAAEEAKDITGLAKLSATYSPDTVVNVTDNRYITVWRSKKDYLQAEFNTVPCRGIYLCLSGNSVPFTVYIKNEEGKYVEYRRVDSPYLHQYIDLPQTYGFRLKAEGTILSISELRCLGEGDLPDWVQRWDTLEEKADLMLLSAHPDDEILWFGGSLAYYAGELGYKTQVVYFCYGENQRKSELLDGLWTCGVKWYPFIGSFEDRKTETKGQLYNYWGGSKIVNKWLTKLIRQYRPDVLLTHDTEGEYGHPAHKIAASTAINCYDLAAQPDYDPESASMFGTWQVKKLYLHYYAAERIVMNWDIPLLRFHGQTAWDIAQLAVRKYKSQMPYSQEMKQSGPYDCRLFGLYVSSVGPDIEKNDFFENIP